jgi:hypothetical protein
MYSYVGRAASGPCTATITDSIVLPLEINPLSIPHFERTSGLHICHSFSLLTNITHITPDSPSWKQVLKRYATWTQAKFDKRNSDLNKSSLSSFYLTLKHALKITSPVYFWTIWRKFLTLQGLELRPLGRPARSQSLYRLRYPGSSSATVTGKIKITN